MMTIDAASLISRIPIALPYRYWADLADRAVDQGAALELGLDGPTLDNVPLSELKDWANRFQGLKKTIHGPFMDLAPGGVDPAVVAVSRKRLIQAAELTDLFQAEAIVFHASYDRNRYGEQKDAWLETSLATWVPVAEAAACPVMLENVYEDGPEMLVRLIDGLADDRVRACFDVGHFLCWGDATPLADWLIGLGGRIGRLHLHDNDGSWDHHLAVGQGVFDFDYLFTFLKDNGIKPGITVEPHREEAITPTFAALAELLNKYDWEL